MNYTLNAQGYRYRPLKSGDKGYDVYALQTALFSVGHSPGGFDGDFGPRTNSATKDFQERLGLKPDGIAGVVTQRTATLQMIWPVQKAKQTPPGLLRGQIEAESAFILGNHSPRYDDGEFDVGVTQRNTNYVTYIDGFDAHGSILALGNKLATKYAEYKRYGKVTNERRLWELAAGSWNAPAWTDRLAQGRTLTTSQSQWIESYISRVSVYMIV